MLQGSRHTRCNNRGYLFIVNVGQEEGHACPTLTSILYSRGAPNAGIVLSNKPRPPPSNNYLFTIHVYHLNRRRTTSVTEAKLFNNLRISRPARIKQNFAPKRLSLLLRIPAELPATILRKSRLKKVYLVP